MTKFTKAQIAAITTAAENGGRLRNIGGGKWETCRSWKSSALREFSWYVIKPLIPQYMAIVGRDVGRQMATLVEVTGEGYAALAELKEQAK